MAVVSAVYTVNTTNTTPTLIRQQAAADGLYVAKVYGRQTGLTRTEFYATVRLFTLFLDGEAAWSSDGATLAEEGSATAVAGCDVTAAINGANLEIHVVGLAATNITWNLHLEHLQSP